MRPKTSNIHTVFLIHKLMVLVEKPEGKRYLVSPRRRWDNNIKMDLREVGCEPSDSIALAQDRDQ